MKYFENIKITYADNKYIYLPALAFLLVSIGASFVLEPPYIYLFALSLLLLVVLMTAFHLYRQTIADLEEERRQTQALISIHNLIDEIRIPLPSMTHWAAKPDLAAAVLEYCSILKPNLIVEAGSGVTTIISGYGLEKNGAGKVISLDHDKFYGAKTNKQLKNHKLSKFGQVYYASLKTYTIDGKDWLWYDTSEVSKDSKIDILTVDGPPVKTQKHARYPALPLLYDQLNEKCVVILDDARRDSESEIVQLWLERYPEFELDFRHSKKGISILTRNM